MTTLCDHNSGRLYYFVPGIRTDLENLDNWAYRAENYAFTHGRGFAQSFPYETKATMRRMSQEDNIAKLGRMLTEQYQSPRLTVAAHSNGCALICGALRKFPTLKIAALHLIAPAEDPDFNRNGLNAALRENRVGTLSLYCSRDDGALKLAGVSRFLLGWAGLGYGDLGRVGPRHFDESLKGKMRPVEWRNYGHSEWFEPGHKFDWLMERVVGAA